MNQKGLAISGILYTLLIIFMVLLISLLASFQNRKTILDELKLDAVNAVEKEINIEALFEEIEKLKTSVSSIKEAYPVGSIYITTKNVNPAELLGGTWEKYGTGKTLVGDNGSTYKAGSTGGSTIAKLTTENLPSHTHGIPALSGTAQSSGNGMSASVSSYANVYREGWTTEQGDHNHNSSLGFYHTSWTDGNEGRLALSWIQFPGDGWSPNVTSTNGKHKHTVGYYDYYANGIAVSGLTPHTHSVTTNSSTSDATGSGTPVSIQDPYIVVYIWKRVS